MKMKLLVVLAFFGMLLFVAGCGAPSEADAADAGQVEDEHVDDDHEEEHMDMAHMHVDPPDEFVGLTNSFAGDESAIAAGQEIFEANCATCHGPKGLGDGPGAEGLDPKPATLADGMMMNDLSDGYLFWRVSKGGAMEPWNSAMPSWEGLPEDQRWQVISYIRTLADGEHMDDDEHMEDEHVEDEHMEDEHMEEDSEHEEAEHTEGDDHQEAEHSEGDEHTEDDEHEEEEHSD